MSAKDFVYKLESLPITFSTSEKGLKVMVNGSLIEASDPWVPRVLLAFFATLDEELETNAYPQNKRLEFISETESYWLERYLSQWLEWNRQSRLEIQNALEYKVVAGNEAKVPGSFLGSDETKYIAIGIGTLFAFFLVFVIIVIIFYYCRSEKERAPGLLFESSSSTEDTESETFPDDFESVTVAKTKRSNRSSDSFSTSVKRFMEDGDSRSRFMDGKDNRFITKCGHSAFRLPDSSRGFYLKA